MRGPSSAAELQVAKTIFVTEIDVSLNFSLVEYVDGRLDILRNGPDPKNSHSRSPSNRRKT